MGTDLTEMGHPKTPTQAETDNTASNSIVNGTAKQKVSRVIDMIFYLVRDRIRQNNYHILWEKGKENLADSVTKQHQSVTKEQRDQGIKKQHKNT